MSFEQIDRAFARKVPPGPVRLECIGCGGVKEVQVRLPLWPQDAPIAVPLCGLCCRLGQRPR